MDFDTGRRPEGSQGGSQDASRSPGSGGGFGGGTGGTPPRAPSSASGGDFNISDPVNSFVEVVRSVLTGPAGFFRGIARRGNFVNPLVFALICSLIFAVLNGLFTMIAGLLSGTTGVGGAIAAFVGSLIFTPILVAVFAFIGAGIYHLLVLLLAGGSNAGYEATFRVGAYASAILVVSWISSLFNIIPVVGPIIGGLLSLLIGVYGVVIQVLGIREVHSTSTGRAVAVVLIPTAVILLLALLIVGAALLAIFGGSQQQF